MESHPVCESPDQMNLGEVVAIIPARGGSKGIPRKNLVSICGHPLLAWSIWAALQARCVTRVLVSTDSEEIASVARRYGADVVMRPAEISGDTASSEAALLHALEHLAERGCRPELLIFLQATSPLREAQDVDGAIFQLLRDQADSCFSASPEHFTGRWRRAENGEVTSVNFRPNSRPMRQDYPVEYLENGSIYVMRPDVLLNCRSRMGGKITIYPMNAVKSLQLDELSDLPLISACMHALSIREPQASAIIKLRRVKLLVFDFDGVFTDNRVYVNTSGEEAVCCSRADSLGLDYLKRTGLSMLVLSTESNFVVAQRCRKLGLDYLSVQVNKVDALQTILNERELHWDEIAYMGNDLNDIECMRRVGLAISPSDAHPKVLQVANLITEQPGGNGAIRQVAEWYLGDEDGLK